MGTDVKTMNKKKINVSDEQITKVLIIINEGAWTLNIEHWTSEALWKTRTELR